ncbi:metal-dependent hydrolase [archaeon]|mgnify:CR=1 FL=1|jgi:inner membrane protein|nr:metal-dependent hydrolase [archaeon]
MLLKTHLAFAILLILIFAQHVQSKLIFITAVIIATFLPDLDHTGSTSGRYMIFRPFQFFVKHRGVIHSITTAFILSLAVAFFWPLASFGFFLGYSVHLICDSFTKEGIQPFWPLKKKTHGPIISGGRIEETLFVSLVIANIILFFIIYAI